MRLTVLGNNGPYPKAGGACSGYLMEYKDTKILIDCGNGVLSRLLMITDIRGIDAIILSHLHSDHISDIFVFKYALGIKKMRDDSEIKIPLYTPTDDEVMVNKFNYNNVFDIIPLNEDMKIIIDELEINFMKMNHPVETYGVRITDHNKIFVYSSDTSYNEAIISFAKKADLFLCEAGVLEEDRKLDTPHLSAKQAGEIGNQAKVKRLLLTHFWPEYRLDRIMNEANEAYNSILEMSEEMRTYYI